MSSAGEDFHPHTIKADRDVLHTTAGRDAVVVQAGGHYHAGTASGSQDVRRDSFQPSFYAPSNPREVVLDFGNSVDSTHPQTKEAEVLQQIFRDDCNECDTRIIVIYGKGGVGKSCILRALARQKKVQDKFPDGIYFLSLGMDAGIVKLIEGLEEITKISGGEELGRKISGEDKLHVVLKHVRKWLNGKTCLLLADDFWEENGLGANVVTELAEMLSNKSMLVVTTRFSAIAIKGTKIEIKPLGTTSKEAKDMLLRYSKFDWKNVEQEKAGPSFDKLLTTCGGLPIFLAIVGKAVAKIALRFTNESERTLAWEECERMTRDSKLLRTNVDGYEGLGRTLHLSMKLLSEACGELFEDQSPYSLSEMHRAFCVFRKQAAIPISVCRRLWKVESDSAALDIGIAFADVGLADVEIERKGNRQFSVIRLHDLVQIFAMKCAGDEGEVMRWHERLLEGYIWKAGNNELVRRWWDVEERSGEYLFGNVCRHLASSGNVKELVGLLLSGEWIKLRHKHGGLSALKQDFSEYLGRNRVVALSGHEKGSEREVRLVRDAVVESWVFVHGRPQELGFQMFGRLVDCKSPIIGKYLESIERVQCRPWLKPMQRLWARPGEGGMIAEFDLGGEIRDIAVQRGSFIAAAAAGKRITIIDLKEMKVMSRCLEHTGVVKKVCISGDRKRVYSWSTACTVRQWDIQSGEEDMKKCVRLDDAQSDEGDRVTSAALCPDQSFVVTGSRKGEVKVWDLSGRGRTWLRMYAKKPVTCIAVSSNGRIIAAGVEGVVLLWDVQTFRPLGSELKGQEDEPEDIAFSPDGQLLASRGRRFYHTIRLWDVTNKTQIGDPFAQCTYGAYSITFTDDSRQIISGHLGGLIFIWDVATGAAISSWKAHSNWVSFLAVTGDGDSLCAVSGGTERVARVWDLQAAATESDEPILHDAGVKFVAASPDGRFFVSAARDTTLRIWNAVNGTPLGKPLRGHRKTVTCVAVSPDSRRLVSGSEDCTIRMWEVATGAQVGAPPFEREGPLIPGLPFFSDLNDFPGHNNWVSCVAYSRDGRFVVSGSCDWTARVWRVIDYPPIDEGVRESVNKRMRMTEPGGHEPLSSCGPLRLEMTLNHDPGEEQYSGGEVSCVAVSQDGQKVLSGLWDREIWVWNMTSGECIYRTKSPAESMIMRIETFGKNEVVTLNQLDEELVWLRWRFDDKGGLIRVPENEDETVAQVETQDGSATSALSPLVSNDGTVRLGGSAKTIATLPDEIWPNAWKYNSNRRILCAGLKDGRVLLLRVQYDGVRLTSTPTVQYSTK